MFLRKTLQLYLANKKAAVIFGVLLVFVALFINMPNVFASSGSMFFDYNFSNQNIGMLAGEIITWTIFLALYSAFVSIICFAVRSEMSHIKIHFYIKEMLEKFALRIFIFYFFLVAVISLFGVLLINAGVNILAMNFLFLLITIFTIFVPQSIVIDEKGLKHAIYHNFEFILSNFPAFLLVIVVSAILLLTVPFIELYFDQFNYSGSLVAITITLLFVVPFIETLKTQIYMLKFGLVKARHAFELKYKL